MTSIGIIGGSGYIGGYLLQQLCQKFDVTSIQRSATPIMPLVEGVKIIQPGVAHHPFDIIINTSYNLGGSKKEIEAQNIHVLSTIQQLSHAHTRVIHLSSLAVFGFCLDKPILPEPVSVKHDYAYVHSKVHMEQILLKAISSTRLSIIRLGNVWGPENNSWTQPVSQAIQWSLPVLYHQKSYSNITYIHHIVEYIDFLISAQQHQLFHHLAEFSDITWQQIIRELNVVFNIEPVGFTQIPHYSKSLSDDLHAAMNTSFKNCLKHLRDGRFTSAYFPSSLLKQIQFWLQQYKPQRGPIRVAPYQPDPTFYWILSCNRQFHSVTLSGWNPSHDWNNVCLSVNQWLNDAGYLLKPLDA